MNTEMKMKMKNSHSYLVALCVSSSFLVPLAVQAASPITTSSGKWTKVEFLNRSSLGLGKAPFCEGVWSDGSIVYSTERSSNRMDTTDYLLMSPDVNGSYLKLGQRTRLIKKEFYAIPQGSRLFSPSGVFVEAAHRYVQDKDNPYVANGEYLDIAPILAGEIGQDMDRIYSFDPKADAWKSVPSPLLYNLYPTLDGFLSNHTKRDYGLPLYTEVDPISGKVTEFPDPENLRERIIPKNTRDNDPLIVVANSWTPMQFCFFPLSRKVVTVTKGYDRFYGYDTTSYMPVRELPKALSYAGDPSQDWRVGCLPNSVTLPDGKWFLVGATGETVIYDWRYEVGTKSGPKLPGNYGTSYCQPIFAADGRLLLAADDYGTYGTYETNSALMSYDYRTNSWKNMTETLPLELKRQFKSFFVGGTTLASLPNGHILVVGSDGDTFFCWDWEPSNDQASRPYLDLYRPVVSSIQRDANDSSLFRGLGVKVTGVFSVNANVNRNNIVPGGPIVELRKNGKFVRYLSTTGWNPACSNLETPRAGEPFNFEVPKDVPNGYYTVRLVVNGLPSLSHYPIQVKR